MVEGAAKDSTSSTVSAEKSGKPNTSTTDISGRNRRNQILIPIPLYANATFGRISIWLHKKYTIF